MKEGLRRRPDKDRPAIVLGGGAELGPLVAFEDEYGGISKYDPEFAKERGLIFKYNPLPKMTIEQAIKKAWDDLREEMLNGKK